MQLEPFATIAKKRITKQELLKAVEKLPKTKVESPEFWSSIASDPAYPTFHRGRAAVELFHRHISVGMYVKDMARILRQPKWIHSEDFYHYIVLGGWLPIRWELEATALNISLFPMEEDADFSVCMCIEGMFDFEYFQRVLLGNLERVSTYGAEQMRIVGNSKIKDIAVQADAFIAQRNGPWWRYRPPGY